jgi:hypothetical protein
MRRNAGSKQMIRLRTPAEAEQFLAAISKV